MIEPDDPTVPYPDSVAEPDTPARRDRRLALVLVSITAAVLAAAVIWFTRSPGPPTAPVGASASPAVCGEPCEAIAPSVTLTWTPPEQGATPTGYRVVRDGAELAPTLRADEHSFVDEDVAIGTTYAYEVIATSGDGDSAPSTTVTVSVPTPPDDAARLDGIYEVALTVRSARSIGAAFGIDDPVPGARGTDRWSFESLCEPEEGACPSEWSGLSGEISPDGSRWQGTIEGLPAKCGGQGRAPAPIEVDLRATDVGAVEGRWIVTGFEGTTRVSFRCPGFPPASATIEATGSSV
jgi:hypothetical protein